MPPRATPAAPPRAPSPSSTGRPGRTSASAGPSSSTTPSTGCGRRSATSPGSARPSCANITTTDTPEKKELTWDEPAGELVLVNRGSYVLTPDGPSRTLLVITEEAEIRHYPDFLVRATLLGRLKTVLRTIQERLEAGS